MDNTIEKAKPYFDHYKDAEAFYVTTDGQFFAEPKKGLADSHERSLDKKGKGKAQLITRKEVESGEVTNAIQELPEGLPSEKWKTDQIKIYLEKENIAFDSKDKKADLLQKIEVANADPESQKKKSGENEVKEPETNKTGTEGSEGTKDDEEGAKVNA